MNERTSAHERLPSTYVNAGFCNFYSCFADFYFHILCIIKNRPTNFGRLRTILVLSNQVTVFETGLHFVYLYYNMNEQWLILLTTTIGDSCFLVYLPVIKIFVLGYFPRIKTKILMTGYNTKDSRIPH